MNGTRTFSPAARPKAAALAVRMPDMRPRVWLCDALVATAATFALLWMGQAPSVAAPLADAAPSFEAPVSAPSHISNGVVESIHELPIAPDSGSRRYELTIRMKDGSLRVSTETGTAIWSEGDKVRLIGPQAMG